MDLNLMTWCPNEMRLRCRETQREDHRKILEEVRYLNKRYGEETLKSQPADTLILCPP